VARSVLSARRLSPGLLLIALLGAPAAGLGAKPSPRWPSLERQLQADGAVPGSGLAAMIAAHQDFGRLSPAEAHDRIPVPLWLRAQWREAHPEMVSAPGDPTRGYPHALKEVHEWLLTHQDLLPGLPEPDRAPAAAGGTNVRISGAQPRARSESDIRVNPRDPQKVIAAANNIGGSGQQAQLYSADGGSTWGQTLLPLLPGDAFHSDPSVDWMSDGTAWATTMGLNSRGTLLRLHAYRSADGGATWTWDSTFSGGQSRADKPKMWIDHGAASPFRDNLYVCWHNGQPQFFNRRTASGWGSPVQISGAETSGTALGCDVKTDGAGNVFVFWPATGNRRILMARSGDGGASFGAPVAIATTWSSYDIGLPAFSDRRALIYVAGGAWKSAARNMVYAAWTDLSGEAGCASSADEPDQRAASPCTTRIWFSRSADGGATWSAPVRLHHQPAKNDQFNPWLAVDETNGQLAIIYYDTAEDAGRKKTHLYYQASFDHGASWSAPFRITTAPTDETADGSNLNQYGDYNGLSGHAGSFWPSWTDRRGDGVEEIWTANLQEGGTPRPPLDFYTLTPCRLIDTRLAGGPLGGPLPGGEREIAAAGLCGLPATARALAVNVTVTQPLGSGFVQVYAGDGEPPPTSSISFAAGQTRSNNAIVPMPVDGSGTIRVRAATGQPVHLIVDVMGYFEPASASAGRGEMFP
jgi:hypothetical protein